MTIEATVPAIVPAADLFAVVVAHAETYKDNGRGWDILLAMLDAADMTRDEVLALIGKTKSEFKAKNNVYKYLQPFVKLAREEKKLAPTLTAEQVHALAVA